MHAPAPAEHAPAKINLALHVTGRRADGYHLLESLAVFTEFGDRLTVAPAAEDSFVVTGPFAAHVPVDAGNLVIRARDALRALAPASATPVAITLEKNLPIASGIGGGSSDAAAALRALSRHWRIDADLASLGLKLGADVPMCLSARSLVARGIGELLEPVSLPSLPLVLVNPGVAVSTPEVFRALANRENPALPPLPAALEAASVVDWLRTTRNDLEAPARMLAPIIGDALDALDRSGAQFTRMSGSGATCFGLFDSRTKADAAAASIRAGSPGWFVAATATA
ncbi:4-(cytidine 5'-diphospho)-2-C-methyl-D-erythritol kinase [Pseudaminobacter soli (ex Li et al. 2025)]|uniref:4-diphosphocytidyl-2-C-methyl-D-erythritol kinase n=1 Tax=Pseudaminobacter soli (ex Li et al. 2025) TaxID=1295366 RepID=A0A2P7SG70_9HYPH|nr:4-(cytidine 5'-diphospho)-2-C-methyl-D-erythritol kinase [Mesorhizobium soli]PSJ61478.1 4-(cytidine 5'-diphospho)-2-C-methyl-D-erythritol kinase [Mesorhizobium soli]